MVSYMRMIGNMVNIAISVLTLISAKGRSSSNCWLIFFPRDFCSSFVSRPWEAVGQVSL